MHLLVTQNSGKFRYAQNPVYPKKLGMTASMSKSGNSYDNTPMGNFRGP